MLFNSKSSPCSLHLLQICRSNIKTTRRRKIDSTDSIAEFSSKIEFPNAVELEDKTKDDKVSSNSKIFNLPVNLKKEFHFDEKSKQTTVQSFSSSKLSVAQKKRTCTSNIKGTEKRKSDLSGNFSSKSEFCNGISDAVEAECKTTDSNKISPHCKTLDFLDKKEFDEKMEWNILLMNQIFPFRFLSQTFSAPCWH